MQIKVSQTVYHCMSWKELLGTYKQNILLNYPTWQLVDAPKLHPPYHTKIGVYSICSLPNSLVLIQLLVHGPWFYWRREWGNTANISQKGILQQLWRNKEYCNISDTLQWMNRVLLQSTWYEFISDQFAWLWVKVSSDMSYVFRDRYCTGVIADWKIANWLIPSLFNNQFDPDHGNHGGRSLR